MHIIKLPSLALSISLAFSSTGFAEPKAPAAQVAEQAPDIVVWEETTVAAKNANFAYIETLKSA